jgi:hypothetical protein
MEPEGSLPWSQEPATGPIPESDVSSSEIPTHPISLRSILLFSCLFLGIQSDFLPSDFRPNFWMHLSSLHMCYMPCPSYRP